MTRITIHTDVKHGVEPEGPGHIFYVSDDDKAVSDESWCMTWDGEWTSNDGGADDDGLTMLQQRVCEIEIDEDER